METLIFSILPKFCPFEGKKFAKFLLLEFGLGFSRPNKNNFNKSSHYF